MLRLVFLRDSMIAMGIPPPREAEIRNSVADAELVCTCVGDFVRS